jgi:hypothetical protein
MGFTITGGNIIQYSGIMTAKTNVEIRNGTVTNCWIGVWGNYAPQNSMNLRVISVRAIGNQSGIVLNGSGHLVKGCSSSPGSSTGHRGINISGGTITDCIVYGSFDTDGITIGGTGKISNSMVLNCLSAGIIASSSAVMSHNFVGNCPPGINGIWGASIIGNLVTTSSGQTGIVPSIGPSTPTLVDQNTACGAGTLYGPGSIATLWGINGGR